MSLKILDREHFKATWARAKQLGGRPFESLRDSLRWLAGYYDGRGECSIGKDFAPHSFAFAVHLDGKFRFNGGLIFHPARTSGAEYPVLSVRLNADEPTDLWQIHT